MTWLRWFALGLILGLSLLVAWRQMTVGPERTVFDFVGQVPAASLRRPSADVFAVREVAVAGSSKRAITVDQPSRIAWDLTVPAHARIEVDLALQESAWTRRGDGVLFRIGIAFEGKYEELVTRVVNPHAQLHDRRWVPVAVDLSPYAGRAASLIFNTGPGLDGDDRENDLAVWGAPRLVIR